jgi:AraC-like DNA-binding protein
MRQQRTTNRPGEFADRTGADAPMDVLSAVLRNVRLAGHAVLESVGDPPLESRHVSAHGAIHLVDVGRLEVFGVADDHKPIAVLHGGDLALLPNGGPHRLAVVAAGTRWLTGTFGFEGSVPNRLFAELPQIITLPGIRERGLEWFDVSNRMLARERQERSPGGSVMISRILDLMYIQILRVWASSAEADPHWLHAGMDRDVGRVLDAIHSDPSANWTLEEMAQVAHLSRTTFGERFTRLVGQSPIRYLTALRMDAASQLLTGSSQSAKQIAHQVGYTSDAAFNRAFTRYHGQAPAQWRAAQAP